MDAETQADAKAQGRAAVDRKLLWGIGSAIAIAIGSLGPWVSVGPFSFSGVGDGRDGAITIVIALLALVPIALRRWRPVVGVLAAICLLIGVIDTVDVSSYDEMGFSASVGWGLILVDVGAASLLAWTFLGRGR